MRFMTVLFLMAFPMLAHTQDINFIQPSDLPKTGYRSYSELFRTRVKPNHPPGYGIDQALQSTFAEEECNAAVGAQVTPFVAKEDFDGFYYRYSISAQFQCLAPVTEKVMGPSDSERLFQNLLIPATPMFGQQIKNVQVLCYENLDEVCDGQTLINYNERETCEVTDLFNPANNTVLTDISFSDNREKREGARDLLKDLPVYRDTRRDDTPGANCGGHKFGQLKGIERKAATIYCQADSTSTTCQVHGIIHP